MPRPVLCFSIFAIVMLGPVLRASNRWTAEEASIERSFSGRSEHVAREVRRELVTLAAYSVFDHLDCAVSGRTVTLVGQVTKAALKNDAETATKGVTGVDDVVNRIRVLPQSAVDDRLRVAEYRAIYSEPGLERYALEAIPPIHIVIECGNVTLEGTVESQGDKDLAAVRANTVSGVFSITNNLQVSAP